MRGLPCRIGAALLMLMGLYALAGAEEAIIAKGSPIPGALTLDAKGRLRFTPAGSNESLAVGSFTSVRFGATPALSLRAATVHQVLLHDGQCLTGQLLGLDAKSLTLRTGWSKNVTLPRAAVAAVTHLPSWRTVFVDDFSDGGKAWKRGGDPTFFKGEQELGAVLNGRGQALEYVLGNCLDTGRVGVNFQEKDAPTGARWRLEAAFQGERFLRVTMAGAGDVYEVAAVGLEGSARKVARSPGLHRLTIQFGAHSLRVLCDDAVLWHNPERGPGGPLLRVRLECLADAGATVRGAVAFSEFGLARMVDEARRPAGDVEQDEVWLANGDQVFGRIAKAARSTIDVEGRFGKRSFAWAEVNGLYLRCDAPPPQTSDGAHVRVRLWPADGAEPDVLEGVLAGLGKDHLTLRHNLLGEVRVARGRVKELVPLFHGRRVEMDHGLHHLGDPARRFPDLQPARAEGPSLRQTVKLAAAPGEARLAVSVLYLEGEGNRKASAGPRTEVIVNGRGVDYLERRADHVAGAPHRLTVALPRGLLRAGANAIELRQPTGRHGPCLVAGLVLELPADD